MEEKGKRSRTTSDRRGNTGMLRPKSIDGTRSRISAEEQAGRQDSEGKESVSGRNLEFRRQPVGRQRTENQPFGRQRPKSQLYERQKADSQTVGRQREDGKPFGRKKADEQSTGRQMQENQPFGKMKQDEQSDRRQRLENQGIRRQQPRRQGNGRPVMRKQQSRRRRKRNLGIKIAALVILVIAIVAAAFLWKKYSPSKEEYDLSKYYGIENE